MKITLRQEEAKLIDSNNEFVLKCYNKMKEEGKNLFFSPISISLCLAMLHAGAKGNTQEQIANSLNFKGQPDNN